MADIKNKFLESKDFRLVSFKCLRKEFEFIYTKVLKGVPDGYGSKFINQTKIFWSRDWEYPWAIINSEVKSEESVLDCGCGGSPLPFFLAQYGCKVYAIDLGLPDNIDIEIPRSFSSTRYYVISILSLVKENIGRLAKKIVRKAWTAIGLGTNSSNSENNRVKSYSKRKSGKKSLLRAYLGHFKEHIYSIKNITSLWGFKIDPNIFGFKIKFIKESLTRIPFGDNFFDKVFCISVIEHMPKDAAYKVMKEMLRVLKKGGLLAITIDNDGPHVNPELAGKYKELIEVLGLKLYGNSDFTIPQPENVPGAYNVVGFIVKK